MKPVFVLSYPRSRTAWLATYLNHGQVFAFHEAWKLVKTVTQLRRLMESKSKHGGPVVNVDCSNWFFLTELQQEFPDACYIRIDRELREVEDSAREAFGPQDYGFLFESYRRVIEASAVQPSMIVDFARWDKDESKNIWNMVTGAGVMDQDWHRQMHDLWIQLTPDAVREELRRGEAGELLHMSRRLVA